jgi:hypothetical protein
MKQSLAFAVVLAACMSVGCKNKLFQRIPGTNMGIPFGSKADSAVQPEMADYPDDQGLPTFDSTAFGSRTRAGRPNAQFPAKTSGSVDADLNMGHQAASQGRLDEAAGYYRRVLSNRPNDPTAHHRLAVIADQQRDYRAAEGHYLTALRVSPDNADVLSDLGYSYLLQKRFPDSERTLSRALQMRPNHERALNNLGLLYGRQGDRERALAIFRQAGSESTAQRKMATLFPQGNNTPTDFPRASQPGSTTSLASGQGNSTDFSARPLPTEPTPGLSDTANDQTARLKQMMEQARYEGNRERMQQQLPEFPASGSQIGATGQRESIPRPSAGRPAAPMSPQYSNQFPRREEFAPRVPERAPAQFDPGRVAENRINDAFSRIDGAPRSRNSSSLNRGQTTNIPPFPTSQDWGNAPLPANVSPGGNSTFTDGGTTETSPRSQVMPGLWPTSNVPSRPIAPASFNERATSPAPTATPSRRAATLAGWNAGPGMLFPVTQPSRATSRPTPATSPATNRENSLQPARRLPNGPGGTGTPTEPLNRTTSMNALPTAARFGNTTASPPDALDVYQTEIDRRQREIGELNRLMQQERQLPAGGGATRPSFPSGFDAPRSAPGRFESE